MSIFPMIQPEAAAPSAGSRLPMAREAAWDYDKNRPLFRAGALMSVTGKEAVKVWIWKALHTPRFLHEIYSGAYGCDVYGLVGKAYTPQIKEVEAARYLRECLMINRYITRVRDVVVTFLDAHLRISCAVDTIYGEVEVDVRV